jgi:chorismate dehydratase
VEEEFYIKSVLARDKIASVILRFPREPHTLTKLRISIVQYLNTAPLVWGFTSGPLRGKYDLSFTVPSQCAEALRTGAADIAIIPAIEYQRIADLVVLPDLAIASKQRVRSLLLVAKKPIEQVRRIALDRSSRSTQVLTRILCAEHWKIAPEFVEADPQLSAMLWDADAALLIGDPALRLSVAGAQDVHVYDIVEEWRRMTNLPAVLAVWAGSRDVLTPEVAMDFAASRDFGMAHIAEISAAASSELQLPAAVLADYLRQNIDFSLGEENRRGLDLYFRLAAQLRLIPAVKAVEWAATADASVLSSRAALT